VAKYGKENKAVETVTKIRKDKKTGVDIWGESLSLGGKTNINFMETRKEAWKYGEKVLV
jgi:hypothetical protein